MVLNELEIMLYDVKNGRVCCHDDIMRSRVQMERKSKNRAHEENTAQKYQAAAPAEAKNLPGINQCRGDLDR